MIRKFVVRVTDYYYGGWVHYVVLNGDQYSLVSDRTQATVFEFKTQIQHFIEQLSSMEMREVKFEYFLDSACLDHLVKI